MPLSISVALVASSIIYPDDHPLHEDNITAAVNAGKYLTASPSGLYWGPISIYDAVCNANISYGVDFSAEGFRRSRFNYSGSTISAVKNVQGSGTLTTSGTISYDAVRGAISLDNGEKVVSPASLISDGTGTWALFIVFELQSAATNYKLFGNYNVDNTTYFTVSVQPTVGASAGAFEFETNNGTTGPKSSTGAGALTSSLAASRKYCLCVRYNYAGTNKATIALDGKNLTLGTDGTHHTASTIYNGAYDIHDTLGFATEPSTYYYQVLLIQNETSDFTDRLEGALCWQNNISIDNASHTYYSSPPTAWA